MIAVVARKAPSVTMDCRDEPGNDNEVAQGYVAALKQGKT
jgi:hypothetical protein